MGSWADGAILLTGATGFVGGELLPRLLAAAPGRTVYCLVRARDAAHLERRAVALLADAEVPAPEAARVRVLAGDVRSPDLGLGGAARAGLAGAVRAVVHAAASTRFDLELDEARRSNVAGTRNALAFARDAGAHFHHVSTAFVVGDRSGVLGSAEPLGPPPAFHNSYEESKWEAEQLVREAARELRTTVYRPSIIVGDSQTGRTRHFRVLYDPFKWVIYGKTSLLPCRPDVRVDVVPVDFVCDAIVALGARTDAAGATWLLSAGPTGALSIAEILARAEPIVNGWLAAHGQPAVPVPRIVSPDQAAPEQADLFALGAAVMRTHVPYMMSELLFDARDTERALAGTGVACPPLGAYLPALLEYALERRFGTA
ncbi:MAG TPA: SDR family oxidoreductase [Myxococcota bacterium]|nr:SDR family oxidoreductase [Myxococcota bacterium]